MSPPADVRAYNPNDSKEVLLSLPKRTDLSGRLKGEDDEGSVGKNGSGNIERYAAALKFKSPREADQVCVCHGVLPDNKRLQIRMESGKVAGIAEGVNKTHKVTIDVSKDQAKQLMKLDDIVLTQVKHNMEKWFHGTMDESLIEDYYRPLVVADAGKGVCVKAVVVSRTLSDLRQGDRDVVLQLVGIQFKKQHFSLVWKFVSAVHAPPAPPSCGEDGAGEDRNEYGFLSEGDDEDEDDGNSDDDTVLAENNNTVVDDHAKTTGRKPGQPVRTTKKGKATTGESSTNLPDVPAPAWEEYENMRGRVLEQLHGKRDAMRKRVDALQAAAEALMLANNQDMEALERAGDVLDDDQTA